MTKLARITFLVLLFGSLGGPQRIDAQQQPQARRYRIIRAIPGLAGTANASGRIEEINNSGKAVGTWDTGAAGDLGQLFVYDIPAGALSFPLGPASFAKDINDGGQILAGQSPPQGEVFSHLIRSLDVNASTIVRVYLNISSTVTRFSITESGALADVVGAASTYSTAQSVIP